MPRLYKVGDDRKRGPSSRVSRTAASQVTSSSSMPVSAVAASASSSAVAVAVASSASVANKCAHSDIASTDFDQFDYNTFDYGDDSSHDTGFIGSNIQSLQSSAGCEARTSSLLPSNECRGNNVGAAASSATSSNSSLVDDEIKTAKSNNNKQKRISNSTPSMKPTVTSPRITHSDLAKNNNSSSNNSTTSKRNNNGNSKKPMGNPISKSSMKGKTTKEKNDENTESHNQLRKSTSTSNDEESVDSGAEDPQQTTKKQQQQKKQRGKRQVSFLGETNGGKSNNKYNAMSTSEWEVDDWDACLQDTDDDDSSIGKNNVKSLPEEKTKSVTKTKLRGGKKKARTNDSSTVTQNMARKDAVQQQQCYQKLQILPQRVLAIDNRVIPTVVGDSIARSSFLRYIPQLVLGGFEKGILQACGGNNAAADSTILASFAYGAKSSEQSEEHVESKRAAGALAYTSIVPRVSFLFDRSDRLCGDVATAAMTNNEQSLWLTEFISSVSNSFGNYPMASTDFDRRGIYCDGFAAEESWSYFGDLVESVESKLVQSVGDSSNARSITLFTTDVNLFSDTSSTAHIRGLEQFLTRIRRSACQTMMRSTITIMIVELTSMMHLMKTKSYDSVAMYDSNETLPNRLRVIECVTNIRRRIEELNQVHDPKSSKKGLVTSPTHLELEFMEGNAISFQYLLQTWVKESLAQTFAQPGSRSGGVGGQGRLSFDLPETLDGAMCSISLDLQYATLPHRIDSVATKSLVDEMHQISMFSPSSVEVIQTIPLSSVDSSLIYGVPMIARAGFEKDVSRYDEMKMLVGQLWTYLSRNSVALVLRVQPKSDEDVNNDELSQSRSFEYNSSGEQLFVLICEEAVQKQQPALDHESKLDLSTAMEVVPDKRRLGELQCNGVLYRYATTSQLLHFGNEEKMLQASDETMPELSDQYLDFIERSLDSIVKTGVNPFLVGGNIVS